MQFNQSSYEVLSDRDIYTKRILVKIRLVKTSFKITIRTGFQIFLDYRCKNGFNMADAKSTTSYFLEPTLLSIVKVYVTFVNYAMLLATKEN